ncbi:MAG: GAF domain-containing protein, partial [Candidatus Izemoplasmatales bacterium]
EQPRGATRAANYTRFLELMRATMDRDLPAISNLANFAALVHEFFDGINWAGFYLFDGVGLYLGPFQGKPACTTIALSRGVCGRAATDRATVVVPDVRKFPGHIACDAASLSEIVVPLIVEGRLFGVLDVDAPTLARFGIEERETLEAAAKVFVDIDPSL